MLEDFGYYFNYRALGSPRLEYFKTVYIKDICFAFDNNSFDLEEGSFNYVGSQNGKLRKGLYKLYSIVVDVTPEYVKYRIGNYKDGESISKVPLTIGILILDACKYNDFLAGNLTDIRELCFYPHFNDAYLKFSFDKLGSNIPVTLLDQFLKVDDNNRKFNNGSLCEILENKIFSCKFKIVGSDIEHEDQYIIGATLREEGSDTVSAVYFLDTGGGLSE